MLPSETSSFVDQSTASSSIRVRHRRALLNTLVAAVILIAIATIVVWHVVIRSVSIPDMSSVGKAQPESQRTVTMFSLLPRDSAIPAVDDPLLLSMQEANAQYADSEQVIGVVFNGEARAYSIPYLSQHEVVNDTVGSVKIAVTW